MPRVRACTFAARACGAFARLSGLPAKAGDVVAQSAVSSKLTNGQAIEPKCSW